MVSRYEWVAFAPAKSRGPRHRVMTVGTVLTGINGADDQPFRARPAEAEAGKLPSHLSVIRPPPWGGKMHFT